MAVGRLGELPVDLLRWEVERCIFPAQHTNFVSSILCFDGRLNAASLIAPGFNLLSKVYIYISKVYPYIYTLHTSVDLLLLEVERCIFPAQPHKSRLLLFLIAACMLICFSILYLISLENLNLHKVNCVRRCRGAFSTQYPFYSPGTSL